MSLHRMWALAVVVACGPVLAQDANPITVSRTVVIVEGIGAPYHANFRVVISNSGDQPDEVVAVSTPVSTELVFHADGNLFSDAEPIPLPVTVPAASGGRPGVLPLVVQGGPMEQGSYWETGIPITVRLSRGGEFTVVAQQAVPAPAPRRD